MKHHFLDSTGLSHLWQRVREHFAPIDHEHTTNDITDIARVAVTNSYEDLSDADSIANKTWVEEKISEYEASFLTTQSGEIFETEADLLGAAENDFYLRGEPHVPNKSDWTIVRSGETISGITYSSRYMYDGTAPYSPNGWHFEVSYKMTLSNAQLSALNSGITSDRVSEISTKYTLPSGGIPKGDLDSAVQESLGKADTALQLDANETVVVWIDSTDTVDGYTSTKNALDSGKLPCTRYGGKIYICISAGAEGEFSGSVNFVSVDDVGAHCLLCNGMASQTGHYCNWTLVDYGFKTKQTAKSDPSASGTTLTAIATITQNANGDITATKKTIQDATTGQKGVMKVGTGLSASSGTVSVSYGTASGTACQGNDSRLSDSRTPKSHTHAASEITSGTLSVARGGTGQTSVANIQAGKDGSGNTITSTYLPQSGKSVLKNSVTSTLKGAVLVPWNATANIAISTLINNNCGVQAGVDGTVYVILNIGSNTKTITGFAGSSTSWELVKGTCMTCVRYAGSYYREDN